jgi:hypothetical protein
MNTGHCIRFVIVSTILCGVSLASESGQGRPRQVKLTYTTKDLVPVISFDVTAPPYSVDKTGKKDCTSGFAAALMDAEKKGGTVFAPAGRYRFDGQLEIPRGVTLRGDWKQPIDKDVKVGGTIFLVYGGRDNVDGTPFITAKEGGVRDLSIFYPQQTIEKVAPYPTTIHLAGSAAVKNVTLVNAYRGVLTGGFSTIMNLHGTTLDTGITMLQAAAVPRCRTVRLMPHYWSASGLAGAPKTAEISKTLVARKAYAIQLNRQDAGIFIDFVIDGYHTAVKFMPPHGWTYWHDIHIRNVDVGVHFTGGSSHRMYITGSSIRAKTCGVLMKMDKTGWKDGWLRLSKSDKPFGSKRDSAHLRMFDCRFEVLGSCISMDDSFNHEINLQECMFTKWGSGKEDYAINGNGGQITVYDCRFAMADRHVRIAGKPKKLQLVGNIFEGNPDLKLPQVKDSRIDHTVAKDPGRSMKPIKPVPDMLPARTTADALYVTKAPSDGKADATAPLQAALDRAGKGGGGTVYLPQGRYRLTKHLKVPAGVELRGINDFMPRGTQCRTLLIADIPGDRGKANNPPLISLSCSKQLGGSGVAGLAIWYPHQDYRDIQPYPWTIRSLGPGCWVQRVYLGNCYNAVDFASHDSDRHVISRVCGSALNIAFRVGKCATIGWIDNCHIRPQDWALSSTVPRVRRSRVIRPGFVFEIPGDRHCKPTTKDIFRGTKHSLIPNMRGAGTITVDSGANEQVTAFFTNGSTRAFDFVDSAGTGGGNASILIGGSEAGWGAWFRQVGKKGVTIVNFSFNPMTRLPYTKPSDIQKGHLPKGLVMRIDPTVKNNITLILNKFYGRREIDIGVDMRGGNVFFKQGIIDSSYRRGVLQKTGGKLGQRNSPLGPILE